MEPSTHWHEFVQRTLAIAISKRTAHHGANWRPYNRHAGANTSTNGARPAHSAGVAKSAAHRRSCLCAPGASQGLEYELRKLAQLLGARLLRGGRPWQY